MATGQYIGVSGVARKVTTPYVGVEGVARNVTAGYVGVNGVARLFFAPESGNVVLEVEKITSNTYANSTTYENEEFILLDIYPKTNGTVEVTYGGLTKTITDTSGAAEPNAQKVFFGTFNGVTDSVATPASGTLTIEGDYYAFATSTFAIKKGTSDKYYGITAVKSFGCATHIPGNAFGAALTGEQHCAFDSISIPKTITSIGANPFSGFGTLDISCDTEHYAFYGKCLIDKTNNVLISGFADSVIPSYITALGNASFLQNQYLTSIVIPAGVTTIGSFAFSNCRNLSTITMLATIPPTIENGFLTRDLGTTIVVPKGCSATYKAATGWSNYADIIVEAS